MNVTMDAVAPSVANGDEQRSEAGHHHLTEAYKPIIHVMPFQYTKIVHLVRHGEGFHNVAGKINHDNYQLEDFADAHLTEVGWRQAEALRSHVAGLPAGLQPEVVYVSPLTRALETAVGAFGGGAFSEADGRPALMLATEAQAGVRAAHGAVSSVGALPFIAIEECREHLGVHPCDRRTRISDVAPRFPAVDFSQIESDEDVLWLPHHRETKDEIRARGEAFFRWLASRPERCIAVVTHSSFLHFALSKFGQRASTAVQGSLHLWYENCEMRTVALADEGALKSRVPDLYHFPGGHHVQ